MGNVSGQDELVTKQELAAFYQALLPYLGGSSSNGGTTYTAGDGISINNDEISIDPMPSEDMDSIFDEFPTGGNIAVTGYVPLGTLISFYGETAPKFFLACDGSTYNKVDYPELAKHLLSLTNNTPYIVDGDNTKFKVPDLRGEFIRGTGTNSHTDQGSGSAVGVHQNATTLPYAYTEPANQSNVFGVPSKNSSGSYIGNADTAKNDSDGVAQITRDAFSTASWAVNKPTSYTSRPTNTSVLFCIAYKDIYSNPMNDYSTDEKVVGTWIDGKTIYQKTLSGVLPNVDSTLNISIGVIVDKIIEIVPFFYKNGCFYNGTMFVSDDFTKRLRFRGFNNDSTASSTQNSVGVDNTQDSWVGCPFYVTIQYTKTT